MCVFVRVCLPCRRLYHGGEAPATTVEELDECRRCCYECMLAELRPLLYSDPNGLGAGVTQAVLSSAIMSAGISGNFPDSSSGDRAFRMIARATTQSNDKMFHEMIYNYLLSCDKKELLVKVSSRFIESYLKDKDPYVLYR